MIIRSTIMIIRSTILIIRSTIMIIRSTIMIVRSTIMIIRSTKDYPKDPCTQIVYTLFPKYQYRDYFKA